MISKLPPISGYKFRGGNLDAIRSKYHECALIGAADTGKSVALCYKSAIIGMNVPGAHGALVRKTRKSIKESILKTWTRVIDGLPIRKIGGSNPESYIFPNGSELVLAGMDDSSKLLSSEWDWIQICQGEELLEADWEILASRTTGRGAVFKHPQIFGDVNPAGSRHWIRSRKSLHRIISKREDNPQLYGDDGVITEEGRKRLELAEQLYTGVRRQRLLYGQWATAEGAVYDTFSSPTHVLERPRSEFKEFGLAIDEGFTNPAVILEIGEDSDGRFHVFREFYKRGVRPEDFVNITEDWARSIGSPLVAVDEAAAGLIADLRARGLNAQGAKGRTPDSTGKHIILDGIAAIQNRLKVSGDGKPRLTIDPSCVEVINELESYVWKPEKDEPIKENDHAMDALRYYVAKKMNQTGFTSATGFSGSPSVEAVPTDLWVPDWLSPEDLGL
jgi:phage terminase large subunit